VRGRRGDRIPDDARASLDLRARERVLAAAPRSDGKWLAATERALVGPVLRIAWADVAHAQWRDEELVLSVDPVADAFAPARFALPEPGHLPETVRERVMASIVVSRHVSVPGHGGVRVVGRDVGPGDLVWQVVPDAGVDGDDPEVRAVAEGLVTALRGELGR
jgi:hypothetical protein